MRQWIRGSCTSRIGEWNGRVAGVGEAGRRRQLQSHNSATRRRREEGRGNGEDFYLILSFDFSFLLFYLFFASNKRSEKSSFL
jgi:hypothetical protein